MNPLKQRELCGKARRWWASQSDVKVAAAPPGLPAIRDLIGRWLNMTLSFSA
jgi:hypothetical protein